MWSRRPVSGGETEDLVDRWERERLADVLLPGRESWVIEEVLGVSGAPAPEVVDAECFVTVVQNYVTKVATDEARIVHDEDRPGDRTLPVSCTTEVRKEVT